jgi:fatty acid desaturase
MATEQQSEPPAEREDTAESDARAAARKRLQKRRDFGAHLVAYVVINAMLIGIWAVTGAGYFWPAWVLFGWGVGLVLNAWDVYFRRPVTEADIDREIERQGERPRV